MMMMLTLGPKTETLDLEYQQSDRAFLGIFLSNPCLNILGAKLTRPKIFFLQILLPACGLLSVLLKSFFPINI